MPKIPQKSKIQKYLPSMNNLINPRPGEEESEEDSDSEDSDSEESQAGEISSKPPSNVLTKGEEDEESSSSDEDEESKDNLSKNEVTVAPPVKEIKKTALQIEMEQLREKYPPPTTLPMTPAQRKMIQHLRTLGPIFEKHNTNPMKCIQEYVMNPLVSSSVKQTSKLQQSMTKVNSFVYSIDGIDKAIKGCVNTLQFPEKKSPPQSTSSSKTPITTK